MTGDATVPELDATALGETRAGTAEPAPTSTGRAVRGETIGRFVVLDVLGTGGMGVVYAAYDPHLDRKVALKVLRAQVMESDEARVRLLREAQAMARIDHPNVLRVHEAGTFDDQVYIAMELAPEGTLKQWLAARKRSPREIANMFVQAGRGLAAAHTAGLIHRDFKPDNVLMFADGQVRVTDFGLVGVIGELPPSRPPELDAPISETTPLSQDLTRTGAMMGTPSYMAPEQFRGQSVGPEADQFAFCIALYEALYGQRPFAGVTFVELCANVISGEVAPAPSDSAVPARIERVVWRGLATDPARRYPTMDDLLVDLGRMPRPKLWLAVGGTTALAVAAIVYVALRPAAPAACSGADTRLATAWNPALQAKLAQTFDATHLPEARGVLGRVVPIVDRWGAAWQQAYVGACEDTRVRAIQSDHMLDLRMACLTLRLDDAREALDALSVATPAEAVDRAIGIARALPDVAPCADTTALSAAIAPPATESARQTVNAIRDELARTRAQRQLAHYAAGLALARHALDDARKLGYRPAIAESLFAVGGLQNQLADRAAADTLRDAMYEATSAGATEIAIRAAADRIGAIGSQRALQPLADELGRFATALSERGPIAASPMVDLGRAIGGLLEAEGHVAEAKTKYEQTLALATKQLGPDNSQTIATLSNLAILAAQRHEFDEARKMFEQIAAAEQRIYGPEHPAYATALDNLANIDAERGLSADSKALREKALAIRIAALGPDHPDVATSYDNLAGIYSDAGDNKTAKLYFEKAVAADRKAFGADSIEAAHPLNNLGPTLYSLGDHATARKVVEEALAIAEKTYPTDDPRLVVFIRNVGLIARNDERFTDALALLQRAQKILEKANGSSDATAAECLGEIATTLTLMGKLPEAREAHVRTLSAIEKVYGDLQLKLDAAAAAFASFEKSKSILESTLGKDHPMVAQALLGRARALIRLDREAEAIADLDRALAIGNATSAAQDQLAEMHFALARALYAKPATRARARAEANLAIAGYEKADQKASLTKARAWLRAH